MFVNVSYIQQVDGIQLFYIFADFLSTGSVCSRERILKSPAEIVNCSISLHAFCRSVGCIHT